MAPVVIRRSLVGVCVAGVAGMIVTSVLDAPGWALTFGLLTAVAALGLILLTAVTDGGRARSPEELGREVEQHVAALVDGGADEHAVRSLVRAAVRLGQQR